MRALPSPLTALLVSLLAISKPFFTTAAAVYRSNDGNPSATAYTDYHTNITFTGYATNTGFQFGMALPTTPSSSSDLLVQLVSPRSGWAGIDFGPEMTGYLMVVAWADTTQTVRLSPRIATGYEVSNGANLYANSNNNNVTLTPIPSGTFVNSTHVAATFVCGGCINGDSFATSKATATMSYAYSLTPVYSPDDDDTQLSDHTLKGELYGPFDVTLAEAESEEYETWAAMTTASDETATTSASGSATAPAAATATSSQSSSGGSSSSTSSSSSSSSDKDASTQNGVPLSSGGVFGMVGLGLVYVLQAVQIL